VLHGYPIAATGGNWLHQCLDTVLRIVHANVAAGVVPFRWPTCVPVEHRDELKGRHGLKSRLKSYSTALTGLTQQERDRIFTALTQQNDIPGLLSCASNCDLLANLPEPIKQPLRDLFSFSFELLTELGIRDQQYRLIWDATPQHVCPFCGCEYFDAPGAPREGEDHYLAQSIYPFAAVNLRNLVPMGGKCNERYKGAVNILYAPNGTRRRVFDPYNHTTVSVSLKGSEVFEAQDARSPKWKISLIPASAECETWDQVFKIRERYQRDILDPLFTEWLRPLGNWWRKEMPAGSNADEMLTDGIARYTSQLKMQELTGRDFLRVPMFEMLHEHCLAGNQRLIKFLRMVVSQ